mmetsp:Transcript_41857/g.67165  ORF Transcript_41857/g.67165 Transcript_41857/m.67165 type:complete len:573 (-) Transcript_41857:241-1959(-)
MSENGRALFNQGKFMQALEWLKKGDGAQDPTWSQADVACCEFIVNGAELKEEQRSTVKQLLTKTVEMFAASQERSLACVIRQLCWVLVVDSCRLSKHRPCGLGDMFLVVDMLGKACTQERFMLENPLAALELLSLSIIAYIVGRPGHAIPRYTLQKFRSFLETTKVPTWALVTFAIAYARNNELQPANYPVREALDILDSFDDSCEMIYPSYLLRLLRATFLYHLGDQESLSRASCITTSLIENGHGCSELSLLCGAISGIQGDFNQALQSFEQAIRQLSQHDHKADLRNRILHNVANVQNCLDLTGPERRILRALVQNDKKCACSRRLQVSFGAQCILCDDEFQSFVLKRFINVLIREREFQEALDKFKTFPRMKSAMPEAYVLCLLEIKEFQTARGACLEALSGCEENELEKCALKLLLADVYMSLKQPFDALATIDQVLKSCLIESEPRMRIQGVCNKAMILLWVDDVGAVGHAIDLFSSIFEESIPFPALHLQVSFNLVTLLLGQGRYLDGCKKWCRTRDLQYSSPRDVEILLGEAEGKHYFAKSGRVGESPNVTGLDVVVLETLLRI